MRSPPTLLAEPRPQHPIGTRELGLGGVARADPDCGGSKLGSPNCPEPEASLSGVRQRCGSGEWTGALEDLSLPRALR